MNKTALKNFATWSRRKLIEQVQTKAFLYGIDEKNGLLMEEQFGQLVINGQTYPLSMKSSFAALQKQLEQKGYKQLLEEAAYTWFNRIIAIRYMEVHDYLPEKVNVLSSSVGRVDPDILFEYDTMDLAIDEVKVRELINAGDTEAAFRILFVAQCNALNVILPFMFEKIQDYTELLLPDFLLDAESVIKTLVQSEGLTESFAEIEVIGWLYQYYIAEEKDRVFAQKSKYKKEEIPFATQLFTPKWIVQYMVQNSLGRYWTEAHREDEDLIDKWEYFIKHEEEDFHEKIAPYVNKELKVEDIKLLDPAMGSGHILVYAFEVFYEIYEKCGYPKRDIPRLILENNLYGLDIDDRAYQLASFAVVIKAASYSKRFLRSVEREGIQLNLASIQETNHISDEVVAYIAQEEKGELYGEVKAFFDQYHNAKTYGSLINITQRNTAFIEQRLEHIVNNPVDDLFYREQHDVAAQVLPGLLQQTDIMRNEYDVVVMNPPYMGSSKMDSNLSSFLNENYPLSKADLFAPFLEINHYFKSNSFYTAINQHVWMFLSSYEELRNDILNNRTIDNMLHLGARTFEEIAGEVVQSTAFVLRNYLLETVECKYFALTDIKIPALKRSEFLSSLKTSKNMYMHNQKMFFEIEGQPISYWASEKERSIYKNEEKLGEVFPVKTGIQTGNNKKFLRYWFEVDYQKIGFNLSSSEDLNFNNYKWFPYNKGGDFRKWYGNNEFVIDFENKGQNIKNQPKGSNFRLRDPNLYFKESITWSFISTNSFAVRYSPNGFLFDVAGSSIFPNKDKLKYLLGFLTSDVCAKLLQIQNPTFNFQVENIAKLPVIFCEKSELTELIDKCIEISKIEWDSYETSWDFKIHPILDFRLDKIEEAYDRYIDMITTLKGSLKAYEAKINEIFNEIYQVEVTLIDEDSKDTLWKNVSPNMVANSLLSYFIGCLVGRFELPEDMVSYNWDNMLSSIRHKNLIFTEKHYLDNDIIYCLKEFLSLTLSDKTLEENMKWLADALELKENEDIENRLRRYFLDEFFKMHCKTYKNTPIYWLVDSGKQKGLRTLIYMHRYTPSTMATIRFEHLQEMQAKYQQEIVDLENRLVNPNLSAADKKKLNAEKVSFGRKIDELREFDKRLAEIAAEEIEIDLDDGVKVNYEKFYRGGKGVLAKIK